MSFYTGAPWNPKSLATVLKALPSCVCYIAWLTASWILRGKRTSKVQQGIEPSIQNVRVSMDAQEETPWDHGMKEVDRVRAICLFKIMMIIPTAPFVIHPDDGSDDYQDQ